MDPSVKCSECHAKEVENFKLQLKIRDMESKVELERERGYQLAQEMSVKMLLAAVSRLQDENDVLRKKEGEKK